MNSEKLSKEHNLKKEATIWTEVCWIPKSYFPLVCYIPHWFVLAAQGNISGHGRGTWVFLSQGASQTSYIC